MSQPRRRQSVARLRLKALIAQDKGEPETPEQDRETHFPCPACNGSKQVVKDRPGGRYSTVACRWCRGTGSVEASVMRLFLRWRRIYQLNQLAGKCAR
jgi:DnaJ-class molecular chaperone